MMFPSGKEWATAFGCVALAAAVAGAALFALALWIMKHFHVTWSWQ